MVGDPIDLTPYENFSESDRPKIQTEIIRSVRLGLERVMIDIENEHVYHEATEVKPLFDKLSDTHNAKEQFHFYQKFTRALGKTKNNLSEKFEDVSKEYISLKKELHLQEKFFNEDKRNFSMKMEYLF